MLPPSPPRQPPRLEPGPVAASRAARAVPGVENLCPLLPAVGAWATLQTAVESAAKIIIELLLRVGQHPERTSGFCTAKPVRFTRVDQATLRPFLLRDDEMQQHHQMDVTVSGSGELSVKVHYRDHVPDLLARFSDEVRQRAARFVWWRTRYERQLLKACREMPDWAKATVRQHLLHERAVRIEARMQRQAEQRRLKDQRRVVRMEAIHKAKAELHDLRPDHAPSGAAHAAASNEPAAALKVAPPSHALPLPDRAVPERPAPARTLTELFAQETTVLAAIPRPDRDRSRGR